MRRLYLHIGHGKTGSSYIQALLATNVELLRARGIEYPADEQILRASEGLISSGNGRLLSEGVHPDSLPAESDALFSSEALFYDFARRRFFDDLLSFCQTHAVGHVSICLFIRDPLHHAESSYQQRIKKSGADFGIAQHLENYEVPRLVLSLFESGIPISHDLTVRNFSRHPDDFWSTFVSWLGIPEDEFVKRDWRTVNRSMTHGEVVLQRAVNRRLGGSGRFLADALCDSLPDIRANRFFPATEIQERFFARQRPFVEEVNARLPPGEAYQLDFETPSEIPAAFSFSPEQLEVIGRSVAKEIQRARQTSRGRPK